MPTSNEKLALLNGYFEKLDQLNVAKKEISKQLERVHDKYHNYEEVRTKGKSKNPLMTRKEVKMVRKQTKKLEEYEEILAQIAYLTSLTNALQKTIGDKE